METPAPIEPDVTVTPARDPSLPPYDQLADEDDELCGCEVDLTVDVVADEELEAVASGAA